MPIVSVYLKTYVIIAGIITVGLVALGLWRAARGTVIAKQNQVFLTGVGLYIIGVGLLSWIGFFSVYDTFPPRVILIFATWITGLVLFMRSETFRILLNRIPVHTLFEVQTFRFLAEILIFWLILEKLMPQTMSFTGRNFDILVPMTAPIVSLCLFRKSIAPMSVARRIGIAWNIGGMLILTVTVMTGILSLPTPRRLFFDGPSTEIIFTFPFFILPAIWVPMAYGIHLATVLRLRTLSDD